MHNNFISHTISKKVYIDDTIVDEKELNDESNLEEVDIPISALSFAFLGKDYDDNDLERKIKIPFTITDKGTNEKASFRYVILKDMIKAETYCRNYFKDEFTKYGDFRASLDKINNITDEEKRNKLMDEYLNQNEEKANGYYEFMMEFAKMVAKIVQCETIVSYNGKVLEDIDEKWDVYANKLSVSMWDSYNKTIESFPFGIKDECDVFIPSLQKKVHRRVSFQFDDFLRLDKSENDGRCVVEFD